MTIVNKGHCIMREKEESDKSEYDTELPVSIVTDLFTIPKISVS